MIVLKAPQDQVLAALQAVSGIVERRHTLPILANVLIRKTGNALQLTTSDLEIQIRTTAELGGDTGDFTGTALDGQVYALKMDGSNSVERLAFHRSTSASFNAQPQASPSPDGRRVIFASDWGVAGGPVQAYVVDTRQLCPNGLP